MIRLFEITVSSITYAAAGAPDVNFMAAEPKAIPQRFKITNAGGQAIYVSTDGVTDHDYFMAGETQRYAPNLTGAPKLWFRLKAAGTAAVKVVEY